MLVRCTCLPVCCDLTANEELKLESGGTAKLWRCFRALSAHRTRETGSGQHVQASANGIVINIRSRQDLLFFFPKCACAIDQFLISIESSNIMLYCTVLYRQKIMARVP